jgi:integrase
MLALSTGARKMELLTLTWRDVDLPRGVITVPKTKNGDRRVLPLAGPALALLQQHARVRRIDTPLVFPRADGRHPLDIRYAWTQAVQTAQIADFRFHDLRHTCASYLAMNGARVVLENNNGLLTPLSAEGLPLLRSSLQQDVHASCQEVDPAEPGSADVPSVRRAAR